MHINIATQKIISSRINEVLVSKSPILNLSSLGLVEVPSEIVELGHLKKLDLSNNNIPSLDRILFDLVELEELILSNNNIAHLLPDISKLKNLKILEIQDNLIGSLPWEIGILSSLEKLDISNNRIRALPGELGNLEKLKFLNISKNWLRTIPKTFATLSSLRVLILGNNELGIVPNQIFALSKLFHLDLSTNSIDEIPEGLFKLKKLELLDLSNNNIQDLSKRVENLTTLKSLYLQGNFIQKLPLEIGKLSNLSQIGVDGNKMEFPPPEIAVKGTAAIMYYIKSIWDSGVDRLFEAKLLVVGQGGVGKTYLLNRLLGKIDTETSTTEGVEIRKWAMESDKKNYRNAYTEEGIEVSKWVVDTTSTDSFRINCWDFGGQEIYHATHQFFLTRRSLYLFVWEARSDGNLTSFDYWLNVISLLGGNSPVLVVMNKMDERVKTINEPSIQDKFPNIKGFYKVSAHEGTNVLELTASIKEKITKLGLVGDPLPRVWSAIRARLEDLDANYISYSRYIEICDEFQLDESQAKHLSSYYHDLGVFLNFSESEILRDIIFLKPDWATNAVYKILDDRDIINDYGKFNLRKVEKIWNKEEKEKRIELLELMKKFELCFQLPFKNELSYIVPNLLSPQEPEFKWDYKNNVRFEYHYSFMPGGILPRFIVRTHDINEDKNSIYWKDGVILKRDETRALVINDQLGRKIHIRLKGEQKSALLEIIRREIDAIHESLNSPSVKEMIPCTCKTCKEGDDPYFFEFDFLRKCRKKGKKVVTCQKSADDIGVEGLIEGIISVYSDKPISTLIQKDELEEAIEELLAKEIKDIAFNVILIKGRYRSMIRETRNGTVSEEEISRQRNMIRRDLLEIAMSENL